MATNYYLVIDGITGDYSDNLLTGAFEVDSFDLAAVDAGSVASGAAPTNFGPLNLSLDSKTLAGLLAASADGTDIDHVSLIGETTLNGKATITYSLNLGDVVLSDVRGVNGDTNLTLDYGQIGLVTRSFDSTGHLQQAPSFGWDAATDKSAGPGTSLVKGGPSAVAPTAPTTYYILIDGVSGGVIDKAHAGWFNLASFDIALANSTDPQNGVAGSDAFSELSVSIPGETALTQLLQLEASGKPLTGVRIEGVNASGQAVYDLNLAGVTVTELADGGSNGMFINFDYDQVSLVTHDSSGKATGSFGWDTSTNTAIDPATMPSISAGKTGGTVAPTSYYLVINGIAGDYSDKLVTGAFKVGSFNLQTIDSLSQAQGSGPSPTAFQPLDLVLDTGTSAGLLAALTNGSIQDVSLVGEATVDGKSTITYSLNLGNATVSELFEPASAGNLSLSLDYDQIGLTTKALDSSGSLQPSQTFGWDTTTGERAGPGTPLTKAGTSAVAATAPTTYYLLIDGLSGDVIDKAHAGWFQVLDINLGASSSSVPSGGGAPSFDNVTVAIPNETGLAALLRQETGGEPLTGVRIEGVNANGQAVYDLNLADVLVTGVDDDGHAGVAINFDFGQISLVTKGLDSTTGNPVQTGSFGWDTVANAAIDPGTMPNISAGSTSSAIAPTSYYLVIDGVAGDYGDKLLTGAFEVSSFQLGSGNANSVAHGTTGESSFSSLFLTLDGQTLSGLLAESADGKMIQNVSLVGESTVDGKSMITYSLNLTDVVVGGVSESSSLGLQVLLNYGQIGLVTKGFNAGGALQTSQSFGWNPVTNQSAGSGTPLTKAGSSTVAVTAPTTYYLLVDGINGGSTDKSHADWFNLSSFNFGAGNPTNPQTGVSGDSTFSGLSVSTSSQTGLTQLLQQEASGNELAGIRIEGVDAKGVAVYDLNLADVLVTAVNDSNSGGFGISFDFGKISLVTHGENSLGASVQTGSFGWDTLANQEFDPSDMPNIAPCYCPGTLILTGRGEMAVEDLAIGDAVITMSGAARPIKWIGRRSYAGRFAEGHNDILPVCIKAGALADAVPRRDLWISPHHAMHLDGVLIEAIDLVNGVTIIQATEVERVEYFHIELETHDVIIAEGSLSESFVDDDSRGMFHNAHEFASLYPAEAGGAARYCAPRCDRGYQLEAVRQRLAQRAALERPDDGLVIGALRGHVDRIGRDCIAGWAQNIDRPEAPVCLDIHVDGRLVGQTLANRYRSDLEEAGLGSGRHSFEFLIPAGLKFTADIVQVLRSADHAELALSHASPKARTA